MPTRINDRRLAALHAGLTAERQRDPGAKIGDAQVLKILAEVGDRWGSTASKPLAELSKPGISRKQQVEFVRQGMSASEKKDLATILDSSSVAFEAGARNFIEAVLGRAPANPGAALVVTGDQREGLAGSAWAGAKIEAINLSTAPTARLHMDDTMEIGTADAQGRFRGARLPDMQEGDLLRIRARKTDGTASEWVTVTASGLASSDTRNAQVALFRLGLTEGGGEKINVANINESRQLSEPGAKLQFTNTRTGQKIVGTIDETGNLPKDFQIPGKKGDTFAVAATDGKNNTGFTVEVGRVIVPGGDGPAVDLVADPALHKDELDESGKPRFTTKRFTGPLFIDGPNVADIQQGQIGDCYFPAAISAAALVAKEELQRMVTDNGDGTYTFTFKKKDWASNTFKDVPVTVDGDLYVRSWGGPLYGSAGGSDRGLQTMELWFPLLEKAYAAFRGSYDLIGNGGSATEVFESVLGKEAGTTALSPGREDNAWQVITSAIDQKRPIAAGTHGGDDEALYTNTGVYADHMYSVLGYEVKDGERFVKLRNPWGESEPSGNGPNDGVFLLKLEQFTKLYSGLGYVR